MDYWNCLYVCFPRSKQWHRYTTEELGRSITISRRKKELGLSPVCVFVQWVNSVVYWKCTGICLTVKEPPQRSQSFYFRHRKVMTFQMQLNLNRYSSSRTLSMLLMCLWGQLPWEAQVSRHRRAKRLANTAIYFWTKAVLCLEELLSVFYNLWTSNLCSFDLILLSKNLLPLAWPHHWKQQREQERKYDYCLAASSCHLGMLRQQVAPSTRIEVRLQ